MRGDGSVTFMVLLQINRMTNVFLINISTHQELSTFADSILCGFPTNIALVWTLFIWICRWAPRSFCLLLWFSHILQGHKHFSLWTDTCTEGTFHSIYYTRCNGYGTIPTTYTQMYTEMILLLNNGRLAQNARLQTFYIVRTKMSLQTTLSSKMLLTHTARVGTFSTMHTQMFIQIALITKSFLTDIAKVRTFISMHTQMIIQMILKTKVFLTDIARVWAFLAVHKHIWIGINLLSEGRAFSSVHMKMSLKRTLFAKGLITHMARVRTFSTVHTQMLIEIALNTKGFLTHSAEIRTFSCMHTQVSIEIRLHRKAFLTHIARIRSFTAMHTQMLVQITLMNKRFLTQTARVGTFSTFHFWTFTQNAVVTNRVSAHIVCMLRASGVSFCEYSLTLGLNGYVITSNSGETSSTSTFVWRIARLQCLWFTTQYSVCPRWRLCIFHCIHCLGRNSNSYMDHISDET